jgi:DNA-binding response OmpR family regulator
MNEQSSNVRVLAVSPHESDLLILSRILDHSAWTFLSASTLSEAQQALVTHHTHVVICDRKLPDGDWKDILETVNALPNGPQLIVTSKDADDRLWAEVLNRGAWDVLVKPFHPKEVYQSIHLAWRHWQDGCRTRDRVGTPKQAGEQVDTPRYATA